MKKRNILTALLCSICLILSGAAPVRADSMKVVTLGADLNQSQKELMLKYFKVNTNETEILYITNADERARLGKFVPLEQIGTRTVSCAYVKPTNSGGIKVRTANLNWVTCNMIATTLSTSGVRNCEVVAACPFEVSGTGALTGIMMAYETASGEQLDETKKELATEELVVTGNLAQEVGQDDATNIINQAKIQIIGSDIQDVDQIYNVVVNIIQQNNMEVSSEQLDLIVSLLEQIANQDYDYDEMKETLENVEENVSGESTDNVEGEEEIEGTGEQDEPVVEDEGEDSIIEDLDESILGDDVIAGSTEDPSLQEGVSDSDGEDEMIDEEWGYDSTGDEEWTPDEGYSDEMSGEEIPGNEDYSDEYIDGDEYTGEEDYTDGSEAVDEDGYVDGAVSSEDPLSTEGLSEDALSLFDSAKSFCSGEFEEDMDSSQYEVKSQGPAAFVTLDADTGARVTEKVLAVFLEVLRDGGVSYVPSESDAYMTPELNMINDAMKKVFVLTDEVTDEEGLWIDVSEESRLALYDDTMDFFSEMYGENYDYSEGTEEYTEEYTDESGYDDGTYDESYEEYEE